MSQDNSTDTPQTTIQEYVDIILNSPSKEQYRNFIRIPKDKRGEVFLDLPENMQKDFGKNLKIGTLLAMFKFLDPDEIADFLDMLPEHRANKTKKKLNENLKKKVEYLLKFDSDSAAGLMSLNYFVITKNYDLKNLYKRIKNSVKKDGRAPTVLYRHSKDQIELVPFSNFILKVPKDLSENTVPIPTVHYDEHYDEVLKQVKESESDLVVVKDYQNNVLGIIEASNLIRLAEREETQEVYKFAGVKKGEDMLDNATIKFKSRYLWLLINLLTAVMAAAVIAFYEDTISKYIFLAAYIPIIGGMGGNAATQTLAVVVRGIVSHEIDLKKKYRVVLHEILAGVGNGLLIGLIVGIAAYFYNGMAILGIIVAISMILSLAVAGLAGALIPFILDKIDIDPAVAATVFVTTVTDVFGFFIFLGLAEWLLL